MKKRPGTMLPYLGDLRSILLGFAIFNFSTAWVMDSRIHFTCAACAWYHPWSYLNEPTILLVAALFLRANRWWTNTVGLLFSSYLIGYFVHLLLSLDDPIMALSYDWKLIRMYFPYIVGSWESQYLFALILLSCSVVSLKRNLLSKDPRAGRITSAGS